MIVAYRIYFGLDADSKVKTIEGEGYLLARGGAHELDWFLHIPLPQNVTGMGELKVYDAHSSITKAGYPEVIGISNGINVKVLSNIKVMFFDPNFSQVNTLWNSNFVPGQRFKFNIALDNSIPISSIGSAPFDPYLFDQTSGYEIHLPGKTALLTHSLTVVRKKTSFKDSNNFPFAMILPNDWVWPNEYVNMTKAYPQFIDYINSGNQTHQDWYKFGVSTGITKNGGKWRW
ncbi:MAG: LruC domain-containing protein [Methylococcaceae bacterium]|nr:LruC domain-containing protein [Methylococcaceae bacterium]